MTKKRKYKKRSFESDGTSSDTSANIFNSMLLSSAWRDLTPRQQVLYLYCKNHYFGQRTVYKENLFKQFGLEIPSNINDFFSLSIGEVTTKYKIYSETNLQPFYRDLSALILHGFIKCIASNRYSKKTSIYSYSDKWQQWGKDGFEILPNEMTSAMKEKYFRTIKS